MSDDRLAEIESRSTEAVAMANYGGRPDAAEQALEAIESYYSMDVPWLIDEVKRLRIENKNLQGALQDSDHAELVQLRAEVERLRTGLSNVQIWATQPGLDPCLEVRFIREIVMETLGQKTRKRNE